MAFQVKDFSSIVASMLNRMKATTTKITDFNIGSVARTLVEAPAVEIDELYQQIFHGLKEAIPVATYNSFDFSLLGAVPASGTIRVTITAQASAVLIASGTVFTTQGGSYTYTSASDVTIGAGSTTGDVLAAANVGGVATNLPASTSFTPNPLPTGFVSASNVSAFSNGADPETDVQRKVRFNQYIQALQRGTLAALTYGAKLAAIYDANGVEIERVRSVSIVEPWLTDDLQPISLVNVYVHNGSGSTSGSLVNQASNVLYGYYDSLGNAVPGWKAAGIKVVVAAATEVAQNISGVITPLAGYDGPTLNTLAQGVIANYMLSINIGAPFQCAEAIYLVKGIPGVANFVMSTPDPSADVTVTAIQKIMPGTFALTNP